MILLDMVGDANLVIPREVSSTNSLQDAIWTTAKDLDNDDIFVDSPGASILDDHRPFLDAGIPAVDLIHYPFPETWHTLNDTPENCDPNSLQAVGEVVETFLVTNSDSYLPDAPFPSVTIVLIALLPVFTVAAIRFRRRE